MSRRNVAYATVKRAVMGLTNQTAVDLGPLGVRVNAVCPGYIVHPDNDDALRDQPEVQAYFTAQYPVGRYGKPRDIGAPALLHCTACVSHY